MRIIVLVLSCFVGSALFSSISNYWPAAVFEGQNKAVLYTGDIRSEPWFVNNLSRNPFFLEYTTQMKTLDCIYLDTSNLDPFKFPTKAEGLKELLGKVAKYPADTVFHFSAWTFGYEDVWVALSRFLKSQVCFHAREAGLPPACVIIVRGFSIYCPTRFSRRRISILPFL